jgi:hypothetical protein
MEKHVRIVHQTYIIIIIEQIVHSDYGRYWILTRPGVNE